jgi:hypothetical protein
LTKPQLAHVINAITYSISRSKKRLVDCYNPLTVDVLEEKIKNLTAAREELKKDLYNV